METAKFRISKKGFYISKKGTPTFVYALKGNDEAIEMYKQSKGEHLVIDDASGAPLFYSAKRPLINATLVMRINKDGDAKFHTTADAGRLTLSTDEEKKYFAISEGGYMEKLITEQRFKDIMGSNAPVVKEEEETIEQPAGNDKL